MSKTFEIICADPPWAFSDKLQKMKSSSPRSAAANYDTMTATQIAALPVGKLADQDGSLLALWVPSVLLQDGLRVMKDWGFNFKQTFVWVKTKDDCVKKLLMSDSRDANDVLAFGMGHLFRQTHEIALVGSRGKSLYKKLKNKSQRSVMLAENDGHSIKPEGLQDRLELMFPSTRKLEMFARRDRPGWTCLGNQVGEEKDIGQSLADLLAPVEVGVAT